ncbi:BlaI/MecI/CopY family transcriptional regulator [Mycolicibacterium goodii]|uniref:BlaI/MecI/CopY family transcriptional regulator n=1 Tax=Mycolicibacterium goodii TaxID=134601 RepID=A0ABS6HWS1_MYCGD|nr:BlaI/MecI/CopY family transcriptional regulator [Mycolicibacterium goodii]MBU8827010.1 BlaI/MecI/CopY family transcriptional regulator [Mycolicibacterium goodii]MBU8840466.1 BlaI/MecI/CopY family transcriptional regulator [Mycolicibacterium goodii]OKH69650.1 CopY family transcriptional regulator [Mycobacterium sp. SWH-M5]
MIVHPHLGALETAVMDRIWEAPAGVTVREVLDELTPSRQIAYTTVLSTLDNLHRKGWVRRERECKAFRYWATMTREQRSATVMRTALESGGNPDVVLAYLVERMSAKEAEHMLLEALRLFDCR